MQNAKIFMGVFSSIQNAKFFMGWVRVSWLFSFFFFVSWGPNPKWRMDTLLPKFFCMTFSSILQNYRPRPKIF
jgi:hypothetical protein